MADRVEQERLAKQAAEAERLQKRVEKDAREHKASETNREAFSKLVKTTQQGSQAEKSQTEKNQAESKQNEAAQKGAQKAAGEADRAARMARGGVVQHSRVMEQAKSFSQVLGQQTDQTRQADTERVTGRDDGVKKDRVERDDRERDVERVEARKQRDQEDARVEAREANRVNAAITGGSKGDKGDRRGDDDGAAQAIKKASQLQQAEGAKGARQVKQIPPELLEKLVSAVYLAVNQKGLKEFQIELKDGPLKGGFMKISADKGKIALKLEGLDGEQKRLIEASKGELMRRLEAKGLTLARFEVK